METKSQTFPSEPEAKAFEQGLLAANESLEVDTFSDDGDLWTVEYSN